MGEGLVMARPLPTCPECGHVVPPEDPTDAQVDAFVDDDSTKACGSSVLWLLFMFRMAADVFSGQRRA